MTALHIKGSWIVITFFMPLILCLTVIASVGLGVITTYGAVVGILHAFGRATQSEASPQRPRLVLVPTQNHAGGD
jgi:hypothetical protein